MDLFSSFHSISIEETFRKLETSSKGLTEDEAERRLKEFGKNVLKEERVSKLKIFLRQFNHILVYILMIASVISILVQEYKDFFVIIGIILLNGFVAFWQELKAETSLAALRKLTEIQNKVIRDGVLKILSSKDLVPGDIVVFHEGEAVTADIRLFESRGLMADESLLTGELVPVLKNHSNTYSPETVLFDQENMLLAGTMITRGTGSGVVCRTGAHTYFATVAEKAQEKAPDTPLIRSLSRFVKGYVAFLLILFTVVCIVGIFQKRPILELIYVLLASLVSAVPEGLPIVLTLVMVIGALKLSKKGVLVRYLPSVETMGSATVIASDKTGTITQGKLKIAESYASDEGKLKQIAALCNDSHQGSGDPIDVALATWVEKSEELKHRFPRKWEYPFDTHLRLMATQHEIDGKNELLVKGAFESLKGIAQNISSEFESAFQTFLEKGYRVLAFGYGDWNGESPKEWNIQIAGLVGFIDLAKEGVAEAVQSAKEAGIRVAMITGDHPLTAKAVAKAVGIYSENDLLITGKEIESQPENQILDALKKATVFARIIPDHKYQIVKLLQKDGEIVSVTGDGVNDVPALRAANIGIAMGSGTEAAKSVSEMVITDNNLRVIVDAIQNARVIADNIRKVIHYLLSTSLQELILITLAIFFSLPIPLSALQILWINIVTDGVQDKLFAFAKEEGNVMKRKPKHPDKLFFDKRQILRILFFGVPAGIITFLLYLYLNGRYSYQTVTTVIFTSVVFAQWANGIQAQKEDEPFFKNIGRSFAINPIIFLGLATGIVLQFLAIHFFPAFFHSTRIPLELWIYPILIFIGSFLLVELRKWTMLILNRGE